MESYSKHYILTDIIQIIQEMHDGLIHQQKNPGMARINNNKIIFYEFTMLTHVIIVNIWTLGTVSQNVILMCQ